MIYLGVGEGDGLGGGVTDVFMLRVYASMYAYMDFFSIAVERH